mgnify:FL=1
MTNKHYILKGKEIIETDLMTWGKFFESPDRIVKQENLPNGKRVSTVFLGLDHNFGEGEPLLFESMVFGTDEEVQERYTTYDEAEEGHRKLVEEYSKTKAKKLR